MITPSYDDRAVSRILKQWRHGRRVSQAKLAALAHCDSSFISRIENCTRRASMQQMLAIAHALDYPPDELLRAGGFFVESMAPWNVAAVHQLLSELVEITGANVDPDHSLHAAQQRILAMPYAKRHRALDHVQTAVSARLRMHLMVDRDELLLYATPVDLLRAAEAAEREESEA